MRWPVLLTAMLGVSGLAASSLLHAGPPQSFDSWSVSGGSVAASCGAGLSCEVLQGGDSGFLQRNIKDSAGQSFLQTIVTSPRASGIPGSGLEFSDESFVRLGQSTAPALNGIADKQHLKSQQTLGAITSSFESITLIQSGWAASTGVPLVDISQTLSERHPTDGDFDASFRYTGTSSGSDINITQDLHAPGQVQGDEFDSVYHYASRSDSNGNKTGSRLAISQNVGITQKTSTLEYGQDRTIQIPTVGIVDPDERQIFVVRRSDGTLMTGGGDVLWMFHFQGIGLDPRQNMPMRGHWFGCISNGDFSGKCNTSDKHQTLALENTLDMPGLPFDPLPFAGPLRTDHDRKTDRSIYPPVSGKDKGGIVMATPGPQTGGNTITATTPQTHGTSAPPPPPGSSGSPVTLTNWDVSNGVISASCPSGHTCKALVQDNGFLQQEIYNPKTGMTYYRTMMTDKGASGAASSLAFATDAVVRQAVGADQNLATGVSAVTIVRDSSESMANVIRIDLGWARVGERPGVDIKQSNPVEEFSYLANFNANGERSGLRVDIDQTNREITQKASTGFAYSAVGGDMVTRGGSAPLPGRATTTWKAGDYISAVYMNQKNVFRGEGKDVDPGSSNLALDLNQSWGGAAVSFISFDNLSDTKPKAGLISPKRSVDDFWVDDPFGPLPERMSVKKMPEPN